MKTKIKKRTVDTQQKCESELFPSMMRPLREVLDARDELSRRTVASHRAGRKVLSAHERREKITTKINCDWFSLRALLCDEEVYALMREMALTQEKKVRQALLFLREYSLLIRMGSFEMRAPVDTSPIIVFALKHISSPDIKEAISSGDYRLLIKGLLLRVEKDIAFVKPLLRDFVRSEFFEKKARLSSSPEKRTPSCEEAEMQRCAESCELILFSMNVEKEEAQLDRTKQDKAKKQDEKINTLPTPRSKAKRAKTVLTVAGLIVPALKIVGFLIPCLALAAIPGVGFLLSLTCLAILGAAYFTYYMAPHYKEEKQDKCVQKKAHEEEKMSVQNKDSQPIVKERVIKARQNTTSLGIEKMGREEMPIASVFTDNNPPSPKDIKPSLGGGQWLKEDRKRREQRAANDKVNHPYKDNDSHPSFPNRHYGRGKSM